VLRYRSMSGRHPPKRLRAAPAPLPLFEDNVKYTSEMTGSGI
jgi:hypothetical protein